VQAAEAANARCLPSGGSPAGRKLMGLKAQESFGTTLILFAVRMKLNSSELILILSSLSCFTNVPGLLRA
jgi:hypothetical protein